MQKRTGAGLFLSIVLHCQAATVSPLLARGYTVLPEPQQVRLGPVDFPISPAWRIEVGPGAAASLTEWLPFKGRESAPGIVRLQVVVDSVMPGRSQDADRAAIAEQAYKIELHRGRIVVTANAAAGLFYGVVTLAQLSNGKQQLPEGEIVDWPDLRMREIYWDDAHHLETVPELKRALRQAASFKINGFVIKLEGHFQYKHAPALLEAYALSPAELQELTDYGLRYHIQLIPYLDAPSHIAFILKHPEYAPLRAFPESNYELCVTNPESYRLLFGMFDDLLAANRGVKYFYLSTDEPYYLGMADNAGCHEAGSASTRFAEFVTKAANYLHDRGRDVAFWGEYPLKPADIPALPNHVINGETYGHLFDPLFKQHGIRQMMYASTEGEEKLFPQYFMRPASQRLHPQSDTAERVIDSVLKIASDQARQDSNLIGLLVAGWGDMGLHPETFWLGYASIAAAGWNPAAAPRESMSAFYPIFYGPKVERMDRIYQLMSYQAQLWTDTWDTVDSTARKPIWGNSERIFTPPHPAHDQSLTLPAPPALDISYVSSWSRDNARRLRLANQGRPDNDELLGLLYANLLSATSNGYNLEVFLAIAQLYRQNLEMLEAFERIDAAFKASRDAATRQDHAKAVAFIDNALADVRSIRNQRNRVLHDATNTWHKSWHPRVLEANGRRFVHQLDDVKDHLPDRTIGMEYLIYRELLLPLDDWYGQVEAARNGYAAAHSLPVQHEAFSWKEIE